MAQKAAKKIIRCFCNCTEISEEDVHRILKADVNGILKNELGKKLFKRFIEIGHKSDVPVVIGILTCYELCENVIETPECGVDKYEEIEELCPSYTLESQLRSLVEDDEPFQRIEECLKEIMRDCRMEIEQDINYLRFRKRMLDKLK